LGDGVKNLLTYLSFRGRANRQLYWVTNITLGVFAFIDFVIVSGVGAVAPAVGGFIALPILGLFIAGLSVGARRLHDRNKSAWWLILFLGAPWFFSILGFLAAAGAGEAASAIRVLGLPFSLWGFVEMGCLKGTTGPNKYGDDPLQPAAEVFA
jgi:uncharacterized membrane protein YhaH (DUF805 family)